MKQQLVVILFVAVIGCPQSADLSVIPDVNIPIPIVHICPDYVCFNPSCNGNFIRDKYGCQTCECNPCKFGQPLLGYPCGQGQNTCATKGGLCKVSSSDNAYCCPDEHAGCCPPPPSPQVILCVLPKYTNDSACAPGEKICPPCSRCVNAIY